MRTPNERKVILASCLGHFFSHYIMLVFPALVLALTREFKVELSAVLEVSFLGYLCYGLGSFPAGILTDRFGARWMLFICLIGCALGALGAGLARDLDELFYALTVIGLASSIYHPAGMTLIARNVVRSGSALGTNGIFGNLGIALAPFLSGGLSVLAGWRSAYLVSAAALALVAVLVLLVKPIDQAMTRDRSRPREGPLFLLPVSALVFVAVAIACAGLAYRASSVTFPTYFEDNNSFLQPLFTRLEGWISLSSSKTVAATLLTSAAYLVGMAGQALGGRIADKRDLRLAYAAFHALSIPFVLAIFALPGALAPFAASGYIFFAMGMQPIENSLIARLTGPGSRGFIYGLKFTLTFGLGSLAVTIAAAIQRRGDARQVFAFVAAATLITALFALALFLRTRRATPRFAVEKDPR